MSRILGPDGLYDDGTMPGMPTKVPTDPLRSNAVSPAELAELQVMRDPITSIYGVTRKGARFVCPLPRGYNGDNLGMVPCDGRLIITHPGLPPLVCDPNTGTVRTL